MTCETTVDIEVLQRNNKLRVHVISANAHSFVRFDTPLSNLQSGRFSSLIIRIHYIVLYMSMRR